MDGCSHPLKAAACGEPLQEQTWTGVEAGEGKEARGREGKRPSGAEDLKKLLSVDDQGWTSLLLKDSAVI